MAHFNKSAPLSHVSEPDYRIEGLDLEHQKRTKSLIMLSITSVLFSLWVVKLSAMKEVCCLKYRILCWLKRRYVIKHTCSAINFCALVNDFI